ncbi:hypothetical protein QQM39_26830 [Streptomyces sp. DT2A-34]|uniref:hypothetical protein n=1 Tax=Streptomyces sp. DT2A-34 TaxID=3051182 RepID=UPI00265BA475|nr:hypothetical protein [Streptomyces sp. DT2A-34]MDO0914313.1 hypothetical protein [Streptomyces sp. DT2A-34]
MVAGEYEELLGEDLWDNAGNADGLHEAITVARGLTDEEIRRAGELAGCLGEAEAMVGTVQKYR